MAETAREGRPRHAAAYTVLGFLAALIADHPTWRPAEPPRVDVNGRFVLILQKPDAESLYITLDPAGDSAIVEDPEIWRAWGREMYISLRQQHASAFIDRFRIPPRQ